jgi:hypothetical protein
MAAAQMLTARDAVSPEPAQEKCATDGWAADISYVPLMSSQASIPQSNYLMGFDGVTVAVY